jgi:DNA primase
MPHDTAPLWEQLREHVALPDLAARYTRDKQVIRGHNGRFRCRCVCGQNRDSRPSVMLYPDGRWKCFACNDGHGDVIDLFRIGEGIADRRLACQMMQQQFLGCSSNHPAGICQWRAAQSAHLQHAPAETRNTPAWAKAILKITITHYRSQLKQTDAITHYLKYQRGLTDNTIAVMQLGYANGHGLGCALWRAKGQVDCGNRSILSCASEMGLLLDAGKGEFFRERIVMPVFNANGEPVYLLGRATQAGQEPKYLNLPDSGVLHRQPMIWGKPTDGIVVVEGPMDLAPCLQWGLHERYLIVTLLGVGYEAVLTMLRKQCAGHTPLFVALDQDNPGKRAALALARSARSAGFCDVRVMVDRDRHATAKQQATEPIAADAQAHLQWVKELLGLGVVIGVNWRSAKDPGDLLNSPKGEQLLLSALTAPKRRTDHSAK